MGRFIIARHAVPGWVVRRFRVLQGRFIQRGEFVLDHDMAQSLARIAIHLVFSTKNRERWLDDALRPNLYGNRRP